MQKPAKTPSIGPVEGIDYAFDYYAFINGILSYHQHASALGTVNSDRKNFSPPRKFPYINYLSTQKKIAHAINFVRELQDPKWNAFAPPEMLRDLPLERARLQQAENILLNPKLRRDYTTWLGAVFENDALPVFEEITPDIERLPHFSLNALLMDGFAQSVSTPYTPAPEDIQAIEQDIAWAPEDKNFRDEYRTALIDRLAYLNFCETREWELLGFKDQPIQPAIDASGYVDAVKANIASRGEYFMTYIDKLNTCMNSGVAATPLTTQEMPFPVASLAFNYSAGLLQMAVEKVEARTGTLVGLAEEKQNILEKLSAIAESELLSHTDPEKDTHVIVTMSNDDGLARLHGGKGKIEAAYSFNASEGVITPINDLEKLDQDTLRGTPNTHSVRGQKPVSHTHQDMTAYMLMLRLHKDWKKKQATPVPPSA